MSSKNKEIREALENVVGELDGTLFGYAADGFEIHYVGSDAQSSWQLKAGERASGPGGARDGTYVQDYEFVEGSGTLDECNGGTLDGQYVYFATDTYPFFPRCFRGTVSSDFIVTASVDSANPYAGSIASGFNPKRSPNT